MKPESELWREAYRQAGIVVTSVSLGLGIHSAGVSLAVASPLPAGKWDKKRTEQAAFAFITGWAARRRYRPTCALDQWLEWEQARNAVYTMLNPYFSERDRFDWVIASQEKALGLVREPAIWLAIEGVAAELMMRLRLAPDEITAICKAAGVPE